MVGEGVARDIVVVVVVAVVVVVVVVVVALAEKTNRARLHRLFFNFYNR